MGYTNDEKIVTASKLNYFKEKLDASINSKLSSKTNGAYTIVVSSAPPSAGTSNSTITFVI